MLRTTCSFVVLVVLFAGSACGASSTDRAPSAPPTPDPSTTTSSAPWVAVPGLGRCGPQPPALVGQRFRRTTIEAQGRRLPAVVTGRGRTVVVLVHQTDGGGLCGWLPFAARIASVPGQTALAFDLCGYGDAVCSGDNSAATRQVAQVRLAIGFAESRLRARRIVLVGASMGGSLTVLTSALDTRVDAAVDLSGPDEWRDVRVSRRAHDVRVPLLVAMADDEGAEAVAAARGTAAAAAPGSTFVGAPSGHGYELLEDAGGAPTSVAGRVLEWIATR